MPAKKEDPQMYGHYRGKPLMMLGVVLFLIGILRFYNVDWNTVLMVIGALLILKGIWVKAKSK